MKSSWKWIGAIIGILFILLGGVYLIFNVEKMDLDLESKEQASGEFILLDSGEVHYRLEGGESAPLVVLVHGFSVPSYVWDPTQTALVDAGYRVLTYDLFGRGFSERVDKEYDLDLFVDQLGDLLLSLEIDEPVVVGGLSMGGPIAARFAHLHPEKVCGVLLISPEVFQPTPGDIFPLNLPLVGEYLMGAIMEPFVLPKMQVSDFVQPERFPDWETWYKVQLQYNGTGKALLSTIRNLTEHDPEDEYRKLEEAGIPVLLIWGEDDQTIGFDQIEALKQIVPEIQIETIPGTGHLPHYELPGVVNPLIIGFLETH